jgi:Cu/Ag efflux protein CusF
MTKSGLASRSNECSPQGPRFRIGVPQNSLFLSFAAFLLPVLLFAGCSKKKEKRYSVQGRVISVQQAQGILEINEDAIPGYMGAMPMSYVVADPAELRGLQPGDVVKADLVISNGIAKLENIAIVRKASPAELPPSASPPQKKE